MSLSTIILTKSLNEVSGFHPSSFSGTLYCYLKVLNKEIIGLREKRSFTNQPSSEFASTGSYYFKNFSDLKYYTNKTFQNKKLIKNFKEMYVSLLYLTILNKKKKILNFEADKFISLGTPKDYSQYIDWQNFFNNNKLSKHL